MFILERACIGFILKPQTQILTTDQSQFIGDIYDGVSNNAMNGAIEIHTQSLLMLILSVLKYSNGLEGKMMTYYQSRIRKKKKERSPKRCSVLYNYEKKFLSLFFIF